MTLAQNVLRMIPLLDMCMTKLYFLGGEDVAERDSREINEKAFMEAGGTPVVLIFNWTAESADKMGKYGKIMVDYFEDIGASAVEFAERSDSSEEIAQKAKRSDLIYLPGGVTRILLERILDAKVDSLLREYDKIIVGNSAGALALGRDCILTRGKLNKRTVIIPGLGLVDFSVKVHYKASRDRELKQLSYARTIYAIPERCALIYDGGSVSGIGDIYLFQNGEKTKQ
ncbi:MAG: Type 1 glutamine amidotransferase-like domain-containing protein [Candidatus Bathyarchaeia archaeon]